MNDGTIFIASLTLASLALFTYKKTIPSFFTSTSLLVMTVFLIFLYILHGVALYFNGVGINEAVIYHLMYGLEGAGFYEFKELIAVCVATLLLLLIYTYRFFVKSKNFEHSRTYSSFTPSTLMLSSILISPASINLYSLSDNSYTLPISTPITKNVEPQLEKQFDDYYVKPSNSIHSLTTAKNIVFIYAESLERTYFDETIFPGLITGLKTLESRGASFTNIIQATNTEWTIAGMTASQCGIPLFTPSHGNSMSGMDGFLNRAECIGDFLKKGGYKLTYMGGSSTNFAGKDKLFKSHGFDNVYGRDELSQNLKDNSYMTGWGLYDDSLFDIVYDRFVTLSQKAQPFGLFTLTLDTHIPGHPSSSCEHLKYGDGKDKMLNAVACSDYLITKFVNKIHQSPYGKNTTIVITSDHLAHRNSASNLLKRTKRKNLFILLDPEIEKPIKVGTLGSSLDIGATLLHFFGVSDGVGLGRNLLNETNSEEERRYIHSNLRNWSRPLKAMWDFPTLKHSLTINIDSGHAFIDNRKFLVPILIEMDDLLQTSLKFQFDNRRGHKTLIQHLKKITPNKRFVLIESCNKANKLDNTLASNGVCLIAGKGKQIISSVMLNDNTTFSAREISRMTSSLSP